MNAFTAYRLASLSISLRQWNTLCPHWLLSVTTSMEMISFLLKGKKSSCRVYGKAFRVEFIQDMIPFLDILKHIHVKYLANAKKWVTFRNIV